ncbi:hypothetical protein KUH32_16770 [Thalassococcus sp. CAU 1522]|uniref:Uncharacterized protein n=1 Tax=Thalassococcus arenae TaxID=2851652 RepID=A0ABS6NBL9_9RHOB|nr:hypothetical protein [Thalassococcus arenae]MBV2361420.1 hypothetical protein [Thalassococcus arenae]
MKRLLSCVSVLVLLASTAVPQPTDEGLYSVRDDASGCRVLTTWQDVTSISWRGSCTEGLADGPGQIDWFVGEELAWRTFTGPGHAWRIENGQFILNVAPSDFQIRCQLEGRSYRGVTMFPTTRLRNDFFSSHDVARNVLNWGAEFAFDNCPNQQRNWGNIAVSVFDSPDASIRNPVVRGRNFPDDGVNWFAPRSEYNNAHNRSFLNMIEREAENIARERRDEEQRLQMERLRAEFERRRLQIDQRIANLLEDGEGSIQELATALLVSQLDTLALLEREFSIHGVYSDGARTTTLGDRQYYAISYRVQSLYEELGRDFQGAQGFSWSNWLDQTTNAGRGTVSITCLFEAVVNVPRSPTTVSASLVSFDGASSLVVLCES